VKIRETTSSNTKSSNRSVSQRKSEYIILDVKTTGLDGDSEIVEIAIIDLDENPLFETLIKPVSLIPEEATAIHGITNEMVENAPSSSLKEEL
jgi:DNA polymerase-3 subunit epsilon